MDQHDLFHSFIDCKVFDRVWHAGLWQVLGSLNINKELVQAIQAVCESSSSAVLLNSQLEEFFKTTVGVRQGCSLSPILFKLFLEKIMQEAFYDHHTSISIGGRPKDLPVTLILWVATMVKFKTLPADRATAYGMEVGTEKSKIVTNSMNNISADIISMNGQKLEDLTSFKYLGTNLCKDCTCSAEVCIRIASALAAMARLNRICWCNTISFSNKFQLLKSLVTSILLYSCET